MAIYPDLRIDTSVGDKKGRVFRASLLGYLCADALWSGGAADTEVLRPVFLQIACSTGEAAPFVANLRSGKRASVGEATGYRSSRGATAFELLRSAGYQYAIQRTAAGIGITAYLRHLFVLDPGMVDPDGIAFICMGDAAWCRDVDTAASLEHVRAVRKLTRPSTRNLASWEKDAAKEKEIVREAMTETLARIAPLWAACLDRRTRAPLIPDARFYLQVLVAAIDAGLVSMPAGDRYVSAHDREWGLGGLGMMGVGTEALGYLPALGTKATHEDMETLLAEQVRIYERVAHAGTGAPTEKPARRKRAA